MAPRLGMNARQRFKMIQNLPPSEARAYAEREADLLARIPRKFVLVKGTEITEPFDTQAAAVRRGDRTLRRAPLPREESRKTRTAIDHRPPCSPPTLGLKVALAERSAESSDQDSRRHPHHASTFVPSAAKSVDGASLQTSPAGVAASCADVVEQQSDSPRATSRITTTPAAGEPAGVSGTPRTWPDATGIDVLDPARRPAGH